MIKRPFSPDGKFGCGHLNQGEREISQAWVKAPSKENTTP